MEISDKEFEQAHLIYKIWDTEKESFVGNETYTRSKKGGKIYTSKHHAENRAKKVNERYTSNSCVVISCAIIPMHERTFKMKKAEVI